MKDENILDKFDKLWDIKLKRSARNSSTQIILSSIEGKSVKIVSIGNGFLLATTEIQDFPSLNVDMGMRVQKGSTINSNGPAYNKTLENLEHLHSSNPDHDLDFQKILGEELRREALDFFKDVDYDRIEDPELKENLLDFFDILDDLSTFEGTAEELCYQNIKLRESFNILRDSIMNILGITNFPNQTNIEKDRFEKSYTPIEIREQVIEEPYNERRRPSYSKDREREKLNRSRSRNKEKDKKIYFEDNIDPLNNNIYNEGSEMREVSLSRSQPQSNSRVRKERIFASKSSSVDKKRLQDIKNNLQKIKGQRILESGNNKTFKYKNKSHRSGSTGEERKKEGSKERKVPVKNVKPREERSFSNAPKATRNRSNSRQRSVRSNKSSQEGDDRSSIQAKVGRRKKSISSGVNVNRSREGKPESRFLQDNLSQANKTSYTDSYQIYRVEDRHYPPNSRNMRESSRKEKESGFERDVTFDDRAKDDRGNRVNFERGENYSREYQYYKPTYRSKDRLRDQEDYLGSIERESHRRKRLSKLDERSCSRSKSNGRIHSSYVEISRNSKEDKYRSDFEDNYPTKKNNGRISKDEGSRKSAKVVKKIITDTHYPPGENFRNSADWNYKTRPNPVGNYERRSTIDVELTNELKVVLEENSALKESLRMYQAEKGEFINDVQKMDTKNLLYEKEIKEMRDQLLELKDYIEANNKATIDMKKEYEDEQQSLLKHFQNELEIQVNEKDILEGELEDKSGKLEEALSKNNELTDLLQQAIAEKEELIGEQKKLLKTKNEMSNHIMMLENEVSRLKKIDSEKDVFVQNMQDENDEIKQFLSK